MSESVKANASAAEEDRLSDEEVFGQVAYVLFSPDSGTYSSTYVGLWHLQLWTQVLQHFHV